MTTDKRFDPNEGQVAAKLMEGEAIMMNLSTCEYYSMDAVGSYVWEMIEKGYSLAEIVDSVSTRYGHDRDSVVQDVEELIEQLIEKQIIVVSDRQEPLQPYAIPESSDDATYTKPLLESYTEMSDILALDPPMPKLDDKPFRD